MPPHCNLIADKMHAAKLIEIISNAVLAAAEAVALLDLINFSSKKENYNKKYLSTPSVAPLLPLSRKNKIRKVRKVSYAEIGVLGLTKLIGSLFYLLAH